MSLVEALAKAQAEFPAVVKAHRAQAGSRGSYNYADLADVLAAVRPVLARNGIAVVQPLVITEAGQELHTVLLCGDDRLESAVLLDFAGLKTQEVGSLLTYMRRYSLLALVGVHPTGEDDDGAGAAEVTARPSFKAVSRDRSIPVNAASAKQMDLIDRLVRDLKIDALRDPFTQLVLDELPSVLTTAQASKLIDALQDAKKGVWPQGWVNAPAGNRIDDGTEAF